jgi:tryptophan-rich sensory protein
MKYDMLCYVMLWYGMVWYVVYLCIPAFDAIVWKDAPGEEKGNTM